MAKAPNILLITADMQRGDCLGSFESKGVQAPHVERLARDGAQFSTCITPNLVCQPARASIVSGQLPLTHGVYDNGVDPDPAQGENGFAGRLTKAGYQTGFFGKAHFSSRETFQPTGSPECKTGSRDYAEDWNGPYMGFEAANLCVIGHLQKTRKPEPPVGQHYERWFASRGEPEEAWNLHTTELLPVTGAHRTWNSGLPAAWHTSTWTADRTIDYLKTCDGNKPFCVWASFPDPHHPFAPPEPWSKMYPHEEVCLPEHRTLDLDRRPWWHRAYIEGKPKVKDAKMAKNRNDASKAKQQTDEQLRHMTANYFSMISLVDHNVGRILSALQDQGLTENTIIVYTSDHGDFLGDHGVYMKGPMAYEGLLRVGMVMKGPGIPAGTVVDDPMSTLDLAATFYDAAGVECPDDIQSQSVLPLVNGAGESRDMAFSEWHLLPIRCGVDMQLRTVRTKTHKLTLELGSGAGEMYNLVDDPAEMDNLFDDPGSVKVRKELENMIKARPGPIRETFNDPVGIA